jgi:phosphoribosyl-AMP cyclohydrolase / phosphoribosyl-ATP pyrophosphohydrolase
MNLSYQKYADGLIPAIVQDAETGAVLMLGFMNVDALTITQETGCVTFYSRSRKQLWTKGGTSGNYLSVVSITADCDDDTLLISARPAGPVCHTGAETCFGDNDMPQNPTDLLIELENIIDERRGNRPEDSYVASLFTKGINKIAQKVGEEAVELVIEAKDDDLGRFTSEAADLLFHYLILLRSKDISINDIIEELKTRRK